MDMFRPFVEGVITLDPTPKRPFPERKAKATAGRLGRRNELIPIGEAISGRLEHLPVLLLDRGGVP